MEGFEMIEPRMPKLGIKRDRDGAFPDDEHAGAEGEHSRPARQRSARRADRARFRADDFRRLLHRRGEDGLQLAIEHANSRKQFQKTLGDFDLVKKKIARMAADVYAMESMTQVTASLIDRGFEDYMLETAMLKVFTTERSGTRSTTASRFTAAPLISTIRRSGGCCATRGSIRSVRGATKCSRRSSRSSECAGRAWNSRRSSTPC